MRSDRRLITAHQANYLPYMGFFEKISVSDAFVLVDDTQFVKRGPFGWIHRNQILGPNGKHWLTLPVKTHDRYHQLIREVEIDNSLPWRRKHWGSLEHAYKKTEFFESYSAGLREIYDQNWEMLLPLSKAVIEWVMDVLDIRKPITLASDYDIQGKGSDYVLELAQKSGASHYLSGMHGKDYLDLKVFEEAKMGLVFQDFTCLPYPQGDSKEFVSHLSIVDAIFHAGPEATLDLMKRGANYDTP